MNKETNPVGEKKLIHALNKIAQFSDVGDDFKAVCEMKSIAVDAINNYSTTPQVAIEEDKRGLPTIEEINNYAWQWAENDNGHGPDKYFADCNFRAGAKWLLNILNTLPTTKADAGEEVKSAMQVLNEIIDEEESKNLLHHAEKEMCHNGLSYMMVKKDLVVTAMEAYAEQSQLKQGNTVEDEFKATQQPAFEIVRTKAMDSYKEFCHQKSILAWHIWKQAFHLGYASSTINHK